MVYGILYTLHLPLSSYGLYLALMLGLVELGAAQVLVEVFQNYFYIENFFKPLNRGICH
jgi:hypothetical protein